MHTRRPNEGAVRRRRLRTLTGIDGDLPGSWGGTPAVLDAGNVRPHAPDRNAAFARAPGALAKLTRPRLLNAVARTRLFELLDERRVHPLVWISGPPGAGKTTLASSYLEARNLPGLWYRVDSGDADPAAFCHFLGLAAAGSAGRDQDAVRVSTTEMRRDPAGFGRRFFRELYARLPRPAVIVLDDYQEVPGEAALHALLADSVREIPDGVTVLVASHSEPPSPYARLVANKTVARVGWDDLRLTPEESRAIACASQPLDDALVDALHRRCDGWATGLALTVERIHRSGASMQHFDAESREAVSGYFAGEILGKMPAEHRHILLATAHLPRVTGVAAAALSGCAHAGGVLEDLHRRQLFVDRLAGSPPSYRYHALFRDFLLARAEETYARAELQALTRRAARILEGERDIEAAIGLYERAEDWGAVSELLLRQAPTLVAESQGQTLRERIGALPAEQVATHPRLAYWYGASLIEVDPPAARRALTEAFAKLQPAGDEVGQMLAASGFVEACLVDGAELGQVDPWIEALDRLLARGPGFPSAEVELRVISALLIALARRRPDHARLAACMRRAAELVELDVVAADVRLTATTALLMCHAWNLDCDSARPIVAIGRSLAAACGVTPLKRVAWLVQLGQSRSLELKHGEALAALDEACEVAARDRLEIMAGSVRSARHLASLAAGECSATRDDLEALKDLTNPRRPLDASAVHRALADHARSQRQDALAVTHAETAAAFAEESGSKPDQLRCRILLAASLVADGRCDAAEECARAGRARLAGAWFERAVRDLDLVEACIVLRRQDLEQCHASFGRVLADWRGERFASLLFVSHPALMAELCAEALRAGIRAAHVAQLIQQYRLTPASRNVEAWPWPIRIFALGGFRVLKDGTEIRFARKTQKRPLELLQALVALGGSEVAVSVLAEALWPGAEGDAAHHSLENALYRLRQLLGSNDALRLAGGRLSLDRDRCWVDVWTLECRLDDTRPAAAVPPEELEAVLALYPGHFLGEDGEQPWALPMRERLREKVLRHVRNAARSYERAGAWSEAATVYQRGLELDNLAEDLYRGLMICHRELGHRAEPLRVYRRCRELLSVVLSIQPSAQTQAVYRSLVQG